MRLGLKMKLILGMRLWFHSSKLFSVYKEIFIPHRTLQLVLLAFLPSPLGDGIHLQVLRDVFHYRPCLTREQFLSQGFVERKLLLVIDVLRFCQAKHRELVGRKAVRSRRSAT